LIEFVHDLRAQVDLHGLYSCWPGGCPVLSTWRSPTASL
jgi:hypothetical protein